MKEAKGGVVTMDELLRKITDAFGPRVRKVERRSAKRAYIDIDPEDVRDFVKFVFKDLGLRFNIASAVDELTHMEILYHFALDAGDLVISLRAHLAEKENPRIHSITPITRSAWWIEREMHELFGIHFEGNDDLRPLLLADDWPKGVYPMRKSYIVPRRDARKA